MSAQKDISINDIEQILETFPEKFTVAEIQKKLGNRSDGLARRLERLLDGDDRFFNRSKHEFIRREAFFTGRRFAVTFDAWELSQGFLLPGHRFAPFLSPEIFPSEVTLLWQNEPVPRREITIPLGQVFHYHMLLGSDNVFEYFLAESPANAGVRSKCSANEQVTLTVYDLSRFYQEHNAADGDALICRVLDYSKGILELSWQSGNDRKTSLRKEWVAAFDKALSSVCERFEDYLDIGDQLTWGLFYGREALEQPVCSLDEYIKLSLKITIRADGDHAVLAVRNDSENGENAPEDLSDILSLSRGETGSLSGILKELGNPVTLPEIDAYILDECYARESDFDAFFRRLFGAAEKLCVDETQQTCLYNYLEERFEELHENYNRADDELKAPLRADILEGIDAKLEFFRLLADTDADPAALDKEKMHHLAEIDLKLDEMLKLLNSSGYTPDEAELVKVAEMLDEQLDEQLELIEILTEKIRTL